MHKPFETYLSIQYIDYLEYVFIYSIPSFACKCVYTLYVYTFVTLFPYLLKICEASYTHKLIHIYIIVAIYVYLTYRLMFTVPEYLYTHTLNPISDPQCIWYL